MKNGLKKIGMVGVINILGVFRYFGVKYRFTNFSTQFIPQARICDSHYPMTESMSSATIHVDFAVSKKSKNIYIFL